MYLLVLTILMLTKSQSLVLTSALMLQVLKLKLTQQTTTTFVYRNVLFLTSLIYLPKLA